MEIYIDIFFLENLVMNYLILLLTEKFLKIKAFSLRMFLGAMIGAIYSVVLIIFPDIKFYYTTFAKVLLSFLMVAVSFPLKGFKSFIKTLAIFYFSTFVFAGAALAFIYFNQSGGFIKNGIVYVFWQSRLALLFLSIMTVMIIVRIVWEVIQFRHTKSKFLIPICISFENKLINIEALVDTGNSLHDPITNVPVVVVEYKALKGILPLEIKKIFEESQENDLNSVTNIVCESSWVSRFRLIPFTSLGRENGMLIGFKPDYVEIGENTEKRGVDKVIIGVYNKALSKSENYKALLSPELVAG